MILVRKVQGPDLPYRVWEKLRILNHYTNLFSGIQVSFKANSISGVL